MSSLDKAKKDLKIQSGRFKRLLGDIKSYAKELESMEKSIAKALEIADEGDRNSKVKLINNQMEETTLALQDCVTRSAGAKSDLQTIISAAPEEAKSSPEYTDAVKILASAAETLGPN